MKYRLKDFVLLQLPEQIKEVLEEGIGMEYSEFVCSYLPVCVRPCAMIPSTTSGTATLTIMLQLSANLLRLQLTSCTPVARMDLSVLLSSSNWSRTP